MCIHRLQIHGKVHADMQIYAHVGYCIKQAAAGANYPQPSCGGQIPSVLFHFLRMFGKEVFLFLFLLFGETFSFSFYVFLLFWPSFLLELPQVEFKGRLRPGKMLLVDFAEAGERLCDMSLLVKFFSSQVAGTICGEDFVVTGIYADAARGE